jgi:hypothetical protein
MKKSLNFDANELLVNNELSTLKGGNLKFRLGGDPTTPTSTTSGTGGNETDKRGKPSFGSMVVAVSK